MANFAFPSSMTSTKKVSIKVGKRSHINCQRFARKLLIKLGITICVSDIRDV